MLKKVYGFSVGITAVLSFIVWSILSTIDLSKVSDLSILGNSQVPALIIRTLLQAGSSYVCFEVIQKLFLFFIDNIPFLKKIIFGHEYVEGTWIGFYIRETAEGKSLDLMVERIEQSSEGISIYGEGYSTDGRIICSWRSEYIISKKADKLEFVYIDTYLDRYFDRNIYGRGFCSYKHTKGNKSTPSKLEGIIHNFSGSESTVVSLAYEEKTSDDPSTSIENSTLIEQAKKIHDKMKDRYPIS